MALARATVASGSLTVKEGMKCSLYTYKARCMVETSWPVFWRIMRLHWQECES